MQPVSRSLFLKRSFQFGGSLMLSQIPFSSVLANTNVTDLLQRMINANDERVNVLLTSSKQTYGRGIGKEFACVAAAYVTATSRYFHKRDLITLMEQILDILKNSQSEDGTLNFGNLESPPDTGFLLEPVTAAASILLKDGSDDVKGINAALKSFIQKASEGLITGGVHTPNHRWVVCAALAKINKLYPDKRMVNRIDEWLDEGIFIDADGHYPERSQNYAVVENNSLITLARMLGKKELLDPVRRNLSMTYYYMESNGDLVVNDSRRQDQWTSKRMVAFYLHYRYMAIHDGHPTYSGIAQLIESFDDFDKEVVKQGLIYFLDEPVLQQELPSPVKPEINFEKLFPSSSLLRIRRNNITSTLFGGADLPLVIASGRSCSPNIFSYRKGDAILRYLRLSTNFFSTGYFYSNGLKKTANGYVLQSKLDVPYYQPLPKHLRKKDGDYTLSPSIDDRFWNKMDFKNRPVSNVKTLTTVLTLHEKDGLNELIFDIDGPKGVLVTIELCFNSGGELSGSFQRVGENMFLETGTGSYRFGNDTIQFGSGLSEHQNLRDLEGERYSTHFGSLRTDGMHVYITGKTPFQHRLQFR